MMTYGRIDYLDFSVTRKVLKEFLRVVMKE